MLHARKRVVQVLTRIAMYLVGAAAMYIVIRVTVWFVCLIGSFVYGYGVPAFTL